MSESWQGQEGEPGRPGESSAEGGRGGRGGKGGRGGTAEDGRVRVVQWIYLAAVIGAAILLGAFTLKVSHDTSVQNRKIAANQVKIRANQMRIETFQRRQCKIDNQVRSNQRTVLAFELAIINVLQNRGEAGLERIPPELIKAITDAYNSVPGPDLDCNGIPG